MTDWSDQDGWIWLDGTMVPWREAKVHVLTHSLHYGSSVFEGVRAYATDRGPAIFRLKDHTKRFFRSMHIFGMKPPCDVLALNQAQCELIRLNQLSEGYLRPLAFYGAEALGLSTAHLRSHVMVAAWKWGAYLGEEAMLHGAKAMVSSFTRNSPNSMMMHAKIAGHYVNSILARQEATAQGCEDAILLDHEGFVSEGSGENIFMVVNNCLYTPPETSVLPGITRDSVWAIAEEAGYRVLEKRMTRDELYVADEVFFTGTAAEITPVREIDRRMIGSGSRGPITADLQARFAAVVRGQVPEFAHWLTYV